MCTCGKCTCGSNRAKIEEIEAGHNKDTCFKIHGVPDWYKDLNDPRKRNGPSGNAYAVNELEQQNPLENVNTGNRDIVADLIEALRMVQNKISYDPVKDLKSNHTLAIGTQKGILYYLNSNSFVPAVLSDKIQIHVSCLSSDAQLYTLWHKRLGHASSKVLSHIPVLSFKNSNQEHVCSICPLAKQTRLSFPVSTSHSKSAFDLLHIDIWGPYKQPSLSGCHYVLTVVDDYSRVTWTFLLQHKSQTLKTMMFFFTQISTQFNTKVKAIRTDNGTDFLSLSCQDFLQTHGIIHQKSCVYTPQQNGVVKRKHRHLLTTARALVFESHLPRDFWVDSILAATHIINKLPSSTRNWKSPFELLYNTPSSYDNLHTFGCLCFASNTLPYKSKFDHMAFRCVFLGCAYGQKAYKLYDLDNKVPIISRDVVFHEHVFSYQNSPNVSDMIPIPTPIPDSVTDTPLTPVSTTSDVLSPQPDPIDHTPI
ncbi:UNVERIFIED_CONTAM: hypothetical protein Slati_0798900 [Sesamum latifolium]|uniref:Integrase catalytic domain-containing protein n=1 Tax=Sesamum latifolium TaxID=2727402 RepID=A0AAW2XKP1_9LAMI